MKITPLVWDTFGAAGKSAGVFTSRVARGAASRFGLCQSRVIGLLRERLASRVVYGIAAITSEAAWRIDAESAPPKLQSATEAALALEESQPSPITNVTGDTGSADELVSELVGAIGGG